MTKTYYLNQTCLTVLGSLHAGIGNTHLTNLVATTILPTVNSRTFKSRKRDVGESCGVILAQTSHKTNLEVEMEVTVKNGDLTDENYVINWHPCVIRHGMAKAWKRAQLADWTRGGY
ncbi:Hypothetical predicted protein [Paramuricea clavata]|uniref:Mutator-like transposase domain-containing protein n=1 Tax=Paramuricea clavata TaxID=317549 RepID=A0A7D9DGR0_PARCT|nr:Hypothetical predicted protein [Paramuricea clavata]